MIKITIENITIGTKTIAEVDAFILATVENAGTSKEEIYTAIGNISDIDIDTEDMIEAIEERLDEECRDNDEDDCDDDFSCDICGFAGTDCCDFCCGD